ncbi:MAG: hydrogenase maturation nickel metallochaperone HypA [Thermoanaerobaculia bacterium]
MHELSIALSLAEVAGEAAAKAGARRVLAVRVRIGLLSGVAADALRFSYELATAGTLLEGSRLDIDELPVVVFCPDCQAERQLPGVQSFRCPVCGRLTGELRQGKELELASLEIETPDESAP